MKRTRLLLAAVAALALLLGACGDDDSDSASATSTSEDEADATTTEPDDEGDGGAGESELDGELAAYSDVLLKSFEDDEEFPLEIEERVCFADEAVQIIGLERLEAVGTPEELLEDESDVSLVELGLEEDEFREVAEAFVDCAPNSGERFVETFAESDATAEQRECLAEVFTDDVLVEFLTAAFAEEQGNEAVASIQADVAACLGGPSTTETGSGS